MIQGQQPEALRAAAQAVIDRWETPLWKDVPATAEYIAALRDALEADHFPGVTKMTARWYMVDKDGMATLCTDREDAEKEAKDANLAWPHTAPHRAVQLVEVGTSAAELHPSPPDGMVGKWMPIETAPKDKSNIVLLRQPCGSIANGFWLAEAYAGNGAWIWPYVHKTPTHWMPLPPPPTSAEGVGHG